LNGPAKPPWLPAASNATKDGDFLHGATPLKPPAGQGAQRDALVCTVDYSSTYLGSK